VLKVEEQEGQQKQTRKDIRMSNMKAQNLLEDHKNNLNAAKDTLVTMVVALAHASNSEASIVLNANVKAQERLVEAFQTFAKQGQIEFDKVHKDTEFMNSKLFSLDQKVIFCKRFHDVARELFTKFQHGFGFQVSSVVALPLHFVEVRDLGFKECLMIERYPCCELGFSLMYSRMIVSCKYLYHCWCVNIHFNTSSKCSHLGL
jgi:hypothetical protein